VSIVGAREGIRLEDGDEKPHVARTALDDEVEVAERAGEARPRLVPRGARRDHLGDERVERRRDDAPLRHAGVDADAGTERGIEARDASGRRGEARLRILGADARLDGHAALDDGEGRERLSAGDADLERHEIEAGDLLGDAVLHLEPRVHLEEVHLVARHQELDRPEPDVADPPREARRRVGELREDRRRQARGRRLLDQLLVPALDGAVPRTERQHVSLLVRRDLHLHVARPGDVPFEEEAGVAERRACLRLGGAERGAEGRRVCHHADAAPTAARGRLDGEGIAEALCRAERRVLVGDGAAAPRRHGDADLLGEPLRGNLVPSARIASPDGPRKRNPRRRPDPRTPGPRPRTPTRATPRPRRRS
jgi:hypothetical protein